MGLGPPNPCNLIRDYLRLHLFDPRCVSYSDVMIHTKIAHQKLMELSNDAPALQRQHLLDLQKAAEERGDSTKSAIILKISPENKRERNGIESIIQPNCHEEAIPLQYVFRLAQ
jgi:hypothetical protein